MAKLTAKRRNAMPKSEFGLPGSRSYPMPDKAHAANAKARATQAVEAGRMSASTAAKIKAKANKKLGKGKTHHVSGMPTSHGYEVANQIFGKRKGK